MTPSTDRRSTTPGRLVLFGATGYTGRLVAEAMVARGDRPLIAGRNAERLDRLSEELSGLETATADALRPETLRSLLEAGDVLVTTAGPFARWGDAAVEAAIDARAAYLDSTGEPSFIRRVFERYGPRAADARTALVTAFGYESVPGNLAAALALREAGEGVARIDIGYFMPGDRRWMSGGTRASFAEALLEPGFVWRAGISTERGAARVRSFELNGRPRQAISAALSEHFTLPRLHPQLREVNAYLGWFGGASHAVRWVSPLGAGATRIPGVRAAMRALVHRFAKGSTGGPDAEARARTGSHVVAIASDAAGAELAEVHLSGVNGYEFTGRILAWGASRAATGGMRGEGSLGPVEAFGLAELEAGCAEAGIERFRRHMREEGENLGRLLGS